MNRCLLLFLAVGLGAGQMATAQDVFTGVERIVAVGDVHGAYEEFTAVLQQAGVIDGAGRWTGGATHLVQLGDVVDRGADSRKALDLLVALEGQAKRAKGRVHALLGNHEAMNMYGDLRYAVPGEFAAFATADSVEARERFYKKTADSKRMADAAYRQEWERLHPLGWVEHRQAFAPDGRYGKAFVERNAVVKINDTLFLHGGISPKFAATPLGEINGKIRAELRDFSRLRGGVTMDEEGPLWYRGLATGKEEELAGHLETVLKSFGVKRLVLAHTPTPGAVIPRFGGRVILADAGMSPLYNRAMACVVIEKGEAFALHRGTRLPIPADAEGLTAYLNSAAQLEPEGSRLRGYAAAGGASVQR